MHDLLYHSTGKIYVGDNLQDRMYEIDATTGEYMVYELPREEWDQHGGLLGSRLKDFPKHETFAGIHSLAESAADNNIFITAFYRQRIIEFNTETKGWTNHHMDEDYYPHTLRVDSNDNVWFTLALSNQVDIFNRATKTFKFFDLPSRSLKETITINLMGVLFKLMSWGLPVGHWASVDRDSTGVPLPYGIYIASDGGVWFDRLHADSIGRIDDDGGIWIAAFP
jgi:virginiamycin B lyase